MKTTIYKYKIVEDADVNHNDLFDLIGYEPEYGNIGYCLRPCKNCLILDIKEVELPDGAFCYAEDGELCIKQCKVRTGDYDEIEQLSDGVRSSIIEDYPQKGLFMFVADPVNREKVLMFISDKF